MALIFQQLMTPDWLLRKATPLGGATLSVEDNGETLHLSQTVPWPHRNVLNVKLHDLLKADRIPDLDRLLKGDLLTYSIKIAFKHVYRETTLTMPRIYAMLVDPKARGIAAVGFRIEGNTATYTAARGGPFGGVKAGISPSGDALTNVTHIDNPADRVTTTSRLFPTVFEILVRPGRSWASCYAPIDSGHLHVTDFQNNLTFTSSQVVLGLYSDEGQTADRYQINHLDVSIYKEDWP